MVASGPNKIWTIAQAKARLSEVLRLAEEEGPQRIGVRRPFIVVPERLWEERAPARQPLGKWLVGNTPRGTNLEVPRSRASSRSIPFIGNAAR